MRLALATAGAITAAIVAWPVGSRADTCGPADGLDYVLPVDGSTSVHPDARVVVRYDLASAPVDEAPTVALRGAIGEVEVNVSWDGRQVVLVPVEPLPAPSHFVLAASRPGRADFEAAFDTDELASPAAPPVLGPALQARAEYLGGGPEGDDACGPVGLERYRVHLELPAAHGSSGPANITYVAFETQGHGVTEPTEVARHVDESGSDEVGFDFYLPADGIHGHACFRALAVDVTGMPSGTTDEACARLAEGPFFVSLCAIGGPGRSQAPHVPIALVAAALCLLARRRRVYAPVSTGNEGSAAHWL